MYGGDCLELILLENWGDRERIGLCGVCVLGEGDQMIEIDGDGVECNCDGVEIARLANGDNVTTDLEKMWCVRWVPGQEVCVRFNFGRFVYISGKIPC